MTDIIEIVKTKYKYRELAEEGNFIEALEFNQKTYSYFYDMYINEKNEEFKAKIQLALEKITEDERFIRTQLNIWERLCLLN